MKPTKSYRIEPGQFTAARIYLVGCGGTGSFAALHLARLAYVAQDKGIPIRLSFIDPDHVEQKNIGRQNFAPAEIGQPKAVALARRYSYAFGLQIEARVEAFKAGFIQTPHGSLTLIIGCVDNAAGRKEMAQAHGSGGGYGSPRVWWLDSGNSLDSGQVLIGNAGKVEIDPTGFAARVPLPSIQEPDLLRPDMPALEPDQTALSCAELLALEAQSLMINQAMAGWVATYAYRLILGRDLNIMATYVNLAAGSVRSVAVTGEVGRIEPVKAEERGVMAAMATAGREVMEVGELDEEQIRLIYARTCPNCGGALADGMEVLDEAETAILFCPTCDWMIDQTEVDAMIEDMDDAREYVHRMDRLMGPVVEEEEIPEGVTL